MKDLDDLANGIHIFDDEKIFVRSRGGYVGLYNFQGEIIWKKDYGKVRTRFAILDSNLIVVYTENKIECLDLNAQVLWDGKLKTGY